MARVSRKDEILQAALQLFAEKGFDGVGVDEIADACGMKGPALYHYFKGKDALLDELTRSIGSYYEQNFGSSEHAGPFPESVEQLTEMTLKRLDFTIHDPRVKMVRRVLAMEQFRNERIRALTTLHHLTGLVEMNEVIFRHMIADGLLKPYDPKILALEYTTPVSMLIHWIDREPEHEAEAMELLKRHLQHFAEVYGIQKNG